MSLLNPASGPWRVLRRCGRAVSRDGSRSLARAQRADLASFEALEPRVLLSADLTVVESISADNRGQVVLEMSADLREDSVTPSAVQILLAGDDTLLGTADDETVATSVEYDRETRQVIVTADLDGLTNYRFRLVDGALLDINGVAVDGEFNGVGMATGNGAAGGGFNLYTNISPEERLIARVQTSIGTLEMELLQEDTPITVQNFLNYMNRGDYDVSFFHRLVNDFVIQGGGFRSDDLSRIETDPPIQNEPGLSNTRGTVAMAKLGGDPNSATNQFFFNLNDNSENLDDQNGGFTVFARVLESDLSLLDEFNALETFDAGSTFSDTPVLDPALGTQEQNLIRFERISTLAEIVEAPEDQLAAGINAEVRADGGPAVVRVFDLDGLGTAPASNVVDVKFNRAGTKVTQLTILDGFIGNFAIQIEGAEQVNEIRDKRKSPGEAPLHFIATSGEIGSINLKSGIVGMDLNGFTLQGGFRFERDIDGDGTLNDPVAVYSEGGFSEKVRIRGDVVGDILLPGGAEDVRIDGVLSDATLRVGDSSFEASQPDHEVRIRMDQGRDVSIESAAAIKQLRADSLDQLFDPATSVSAPSIDKLQIKGDFDPTLTVTGPADPTLPAIRNLKIDGDIVGSTWSINGAVDRLKLKGDIGAWEATFGGDVPMLKLGSVVSSSVTIEGETRKVQADEWLGGGVTVEGPVKQFRVRGDAEGEFRFNTQSQGEQNIRKIDIRGEADNLVLRPNAQVNKLRIDGPARDLDIDTTDRIGRIDVRGAVEGDSRIFVNERVDRVRVDGNYEGELTLRFVDQVNIDGVFIGVFNALEVDTLNIESDAEIELDVQTVQRLIVGGDLLNSTLLFRNFPFPPQQVDTVFEEIRIGGRMENVQATINGGGGELTADAMIDSSIYFENDDALVGMPDSLEAEYRLERFVIRGLDDGQASFIDSVLAVDELGEAFIMRPETFNFARPFGIAAGSIDFVETRFLDGSRVRKNEPNQTLDPVGDYQVRVNFEAPA